MQVELCSQQARGILNFLKVLTTNQRSSKKVGILAATFSHALTGQQILDLKLVLTMWVGNKSDLM